MKTPLLVVGMPRSGTTWVGEILSTASGVHYLFEPDNEKISPAAWYYKEKLHRFPYLVATEEAPPYAALWRAILSGALINPIYTILEKYFRQQTFGVETHIGDKTGFSYTDGTFNGVAPSGRSVTFDVRRRRFFAHAVRLTTGSKLPRKNSDQLIVKSVHSPLALDWLTAHFDVQIVVVLRNPYSLFASLKRMRMPDGNRNLLSQTTLRTDLQDFLDAPYSFGSSEATAVAVQTALMLKILAQQIERHANWPVISHDRLCVDTESHYRRLFNTLQLPWSEATDARLSALNQAGTGFAPARLTELQPTRWRSELDDCEVAEVDKWIAHFELTDFLDDYVY